MSGVGDFLFGSEGEPGKVIDTTPDEFIGLRGPVADALKGLISSGGGPSFSGVPTVASGKNPFASPLGANEKTILDSLVSGNATAAGSTSAARDLLTRTVGGEFLPGESGSNPFLKAAIEAAQRPVIEAFQSQIIPKLRTSFTRAGHFIQPGSSSPFEEAAAIASRGLANSLGDIATNLSFGNFEAERGRQQTAATALPQVETADVDRTIKTLQAAALPRLIEQLGIDRGLEEFRRRVDVLLQAIGAGGRLGQAETVTTAPTPGTSGLIPDILGAAGQKVGEAGGAALAAAIFSDRRLKENIERIGMLPVTGLALYEFNFIGDARRRVGLMADEVERVMPEAVGERDGFKTVDYAAVLRRETH